MVLGITFFPASDRGLCANHYLHNLKLLKRFICISHFHCWNSTFSKYLTSHFGIFFSSFKANTKKYHRLRSETTIRSLYLVKEYWILGRTSIMCKATPQLMKLLSSYSITLTAAAATADHSIGTYRTSYSKYRKLFLCFKVSIISNRLPSTTHKPYEVNHWLLKMLLFWLLKHFDGISIDIWVTRWWDAFSTILANEAC